MFSPLKLQLIPNAFVKWQPIQGHERMLKKTDEVP